MGKLLCKEQKQGQNKLNFDLKNLEINQKKSLRKIRFPAKTSETNQEEGQFRSVLN